MSETQAANDARHARGILIENGSEVIHLGIPGTDYRLHLMVYKRVSAEEGKRAVGTIRAQARRIDVVNTGGKYVEPVYGRPRRVQGEIIATDPSDQSVIVDAGFPIVCQTMAPQTPNDFRVGDFVSFDVMSGASFTPA